MEPLHPVVTDDPTKRPTGNIIVTDTGLVLHEYARECHMCGNWRSGTWCYNCERWMCWKHLGPAAYWEPDRRICPVCAELPMYTRKRLISER